MDRHLEANPDQRVVLTTIPWLYYISETDRAERNRAHMPWVEGNGDYGTREPLGFNSRAVIKNDKSLAPPPPDALSPYRPEHPPKTVIQKRGSPSHGDDDAAENLSNETSFILKKQQEESKDCSHSFNNRQKWALDFGGIADVNMEFGLPIPKSIDHVHYKCGLHVDERKSGEIVFVRDNNMGCRDPMNEALIQWLIQLLLRI